MIGAMKIRTGTLSVAVPRALSLLAVASILSGLILLSGCGDDETTSTAAAPSGPLPESTQKELEAAVNDSFPKAAAPGAVIAVQTPEGRWIKAVGVAKDKTDEPMEPGLHVRIGSVTKTFTGTALMRLAEKGELSLDDPISDYVADVPRGGKITLSQLADMTSGIQSYTKQDAFTDVLFNHPEKVWTPDEVLEIGIAEPPLFKPGTEFDYSNTNTVLLGLAIEKVTGETLGEVFSEQIFEPLGLTSTSWPGKSAEMPEPYANGYTLQGQPPDEPADATFFNPSWGFAAGDLISNADDMLVYGRALGTGEGLLTPEFQEQRIASLNADIPPLDENNQYGIGISSNHGWLGHTGSLQGYNTTVYYHPDIDTTVVVEATSDIARGACEAKPTLSSDSPELQRESCADPGQRIFAAVAEALGRPFEPAPG
jgi:D-alanyl-D-alanine carboxypeptidase